jgi:hypothetical protein
MATIDITKLYCVKTRDGVGKDEIDIYLALDGGALDFISGPHFLDKSKNDDEVTLYIHEPFSTDASVQLRERNGDKGGNNDLVLETHDFGPNERDPDAVAFSGNNGRVVYHATIGVRV